jgi:predicted amidohydrolase
MSVEGCRNMAQAYAIESQSFVLHATCVITDAGTELMKTKGAPIMGASIVGSSAVIGPDGRILSAPETPNEQLIIADLDLNLVTKVSFRWGRD